MIFKELQPAVDRPSECEENNIGQMEGRQSVNERDSVCVGE